MSPAAMLQGAALGLAFIGLVEALDAGLHVWIVDRFYRAIGSRE